MVEKENEASTQARDSALDDAFGKLEAGQQRETVKPSDVPANNTSAAGSLIAGLLSLIAIGMASFVIYESRMPAVPEADSVTENLDIIELRQHLKETNATTASLSARLDDLVSEQAVALDDTRATLESKIGDLIETRGTTSEDWLLAEVEYLVRMANQRVLMEKDANAALALLRSADGILKDAENLTAFSLRQALADDMSKLEAAPDLDTEGMYLQLSALVSQVSGLRQPVLSFTPVDVPAKESSQAANSWLDKALAVLGSVTSRLTSLVDYRRDAVEVTPILPPAEEYYLRQNLILKLQLAQLGLLENNARVYSTSLIEAGNWVEQYFDQDDSATIAMHEAIRELAAKDVARELPAIDASLREIRSLLGQFKQAGTSS